MTTLAVSEPQKIERVNTIRQPYIDEVFDLYNGNLGDVAHVGIDYLGITSRDDEKPVLGTSGFPTCLVATGYDSLSGDSFLFHKSNAVPRKFLINVYSALPEGDYDVTVFRTPGLYPSEAESEIREILSMEQFFRVKLHLNDVINLTQKSPGGNSPCDGIALDSRTGNHYTYRLDEPRESDRSRLIEI
ncbi:MAG: hypothetical protein ABIJ92_01260 [Candidatus Aenigmatarchaeota archaeon]